MDLYRLVNKPNFVSKKQYILMMLENNDQLKRVNRISLILSGVNFSGFLVLGLILWEFEMSIFWLFAMMIYPCYLYLRYSLSLDKSDRNMPMMPSLWGTLLVFLILGAIFGASMVIMDLMGMTILDL